jgi:WD40 repeat protein
VGVYVVMDLVEGATLQERITRAGPLPEAEAARVVREVAGAVAHLHGHDLVHRDLKPDNVLLSGRRPLLTDFGLLLDLSGEAERLTRTGVSLGTPGYWAPEQALGQREQAGVSTDVYGLGAILYGCLTGRPPIYAETPQRLIELTMKHAVAPPEALRLGLDPALAEVCMRALAREPADRYASASELIDALDRWTSQSGSSAQGAAAARGGLPGAAWAALVAALVALAAAGVLAVVGRGSRAPADAPPPAPTPAVAAEEAAPEGVAAVASDLPEVVEETLAGTDLPGWAEGLVAGRRIRLRQVWSDGPGYLTYPGKALVAVGDALVSLSAPGSLPPPPGIDAQLSGRGPVRVWDASTGRERLRLVTGSDRVRALAVTLDGGTLALATREGLQLWDTSSWRRTKVLEHPGGPRVVDDLAFSASGRRLAVSGWYSYRGERETPPVHVWDLAAGEVIAEIPERVSYVAFRGEDQLALAGRWNTTVTLWDLAAGEPLFSGENGSMLDLVVTPDRRHVLSNAWGKKALTAWDVERGELMRTIPCETGLTRLLPLNGFRILAATATGSVLEVDVARGAVVRRGSKALGTMFAAALLPDRRVVQAGTMQRLVPFGTDLEPGTWPGDAHHEGPVLATSRHDGKRWTLTAGGLWLWEPGKEQGLRMGPMPGKGLAAAVSPDGRFLVVARTQAAVLDLSLGVTVSRTGVGDDRMVAVGVAPGGLHVLASAGTGRKGVPDKLFHVWNQTDDAESRWVQLKDGDAVLDARSLATSVDGARGFSGHDDGSVRSWDLFEDTLLRRFPPPEGEPVEAKAKAPKLSVLRLVATAKVLVAGHRTGLVRRWRLTDGEALPPVRVEGEALDPVTCLLPLDEEASLLLVAHEGGALRLVSTSAEGARDLDRVTFDGDFVRSASLSADGKRVLAGTQRGHLVEFAVD